MQKLALILLFSATVLCTFPTYVNDSNNFNHIYAQMQPPEPPYQPSVLQPPTGVKISSPTTNQNVSTGELTIIGTSTDTPSSQCQVYTDWNDRKPFQRAVAAGPAGNGDYSRWNYTYTAAYHEITNGTNELTSKISCLANPTNLTKWYSINITGVEGLIPPTEGYVQSISQVQDNSTGNLSSNSIGLVSPLTSINAAQINSPRLESLVDSDDSDDDQDDDDNDNDSEQQEEEENDRDSAGADIVNDDSNDDETNDEDDSSDDEKVVATNEDNLEEDEDEPIVIQDTARNVDGEGGDNSNRDVDNEPIPDSGSAEEEFTPTSNSELEEQEEDEQEESDIVSLDTPPKPEISTIPSASSIQSSPHDNLDEDEDEDEDGDGDDCNIGDEGFPFCDGRSGIEDGDDCNIGDEGFPFCDGRPAD